MVKRLRLLVGLQKCCSLRDYFLKMLHRHPPIRDIEPKSPEISGAFNFKMR